MKIRNIYFKKGIPFVSLAFFIMCVAISLRVNRIFLK